MNKNELFYFLDCINDNKNTNVITGYIFSLDEYTNYVDINTEVAYVINTPTTVIVDIPGCRPFEVKRYGKYTKSLIDIIESLFVNVIFL